MVAHQSKRKPPRSHWRLKTSSCSLVALVSHWLLARSRRQMLTSQTWSVTTISSSRSLKFSDHKTRRVSASARKLPSRTMSSRCKMTWSSKTLTQGSAALVKTLEIFLSRCSPSTPNNVSPLPNVYKIPFLTTSDKKKWNNLQKNRSI